MMSKEAMAPPKAAGDDDFVLTISDNDEIPSFSETESEPQVADSSPWETSVSRTEAGKKRKRELDLVLESKNNKKPNKKQKTTKTKADNPAAERDSGSEEEAIGEKDGAIDSDFEFDAGDKDIFHVVEDFDGWEEKPSKKHDRRVNGDKKAVDIDEIIARRAGKKAGHRPETTKTHGNNEDLRHSAFDEEDDEDRSEDEDVKEAEDDVPAFEDDETLAIDGFGAGAASEEDDDDESDADNQESGANDGGLEDSENESVASPTAHPDDLASDSEAESQSSASDAEERAKQAAFFAEESTASLTKAPVFSSDSFQQFSLSRPILRALGSLNFHTPTPIQARTIPIALRGLDVVGSAVTGSGKTAAFLLPILERLLYRPRKVPSTRVAILMPTRELAVQCYNVATSLAAHTDITFAQLVGGFSLRDQEALLKRRPDVVIATPGRFIDHMRNSASFSVETLEILVLDEADRMLEDGFADELNEILKTIPRGRQTMLFSATMTDSVDKLVRLGMVRPVRVSVDAKKATTAGLVQEFVRLRPGRDGQGKRLASLLVLCEKIYKDRAIVFFRQKKEAHRVRVVFGLMGIKAGELHGGMSQEQRIKAVGDFREGRTSHLLATDLASRGLDIRNVLTVVNYEAPQSHEIYVHRVGRTARAGRSGRACTIAAEQDRKVVKAAVKSARAQGAKVVSRVIEIADVDKMDKKIQGMQDEIDEILEEEKEEKQLAQAETQIVRGENLVKHEAEIMSRPKRTWFESEKEKRLAKKAGRAELNGPDLKRVLVKAAGGGKKLSGKDKKRLDDRREHIEGRTWRKGKGRAQVAEATRSARSPRTAGRGSKGKPHRGKPFKRKDR